MTLAELTNHVTKIERLGLKVTSLVMQRKFTPQGEKVQTPFGLCSVVDVDVTSLDGMINIAFLVEVARVKDFLETVESIGGLSFYL